MSTSRHFSRLPRMALLALLGFAILATTPLFLSSGDAAAQEVRKRRSVIEFLFGSRPKIKDANTAIKKKVVKKKRRLSAGDPAVTGAEVAVEKLPDAKKILVIGDFMATALGDGLIVALAADAGLVVEKRTDGASGLVRQDHLDWAAKLATDIDEVKPALVVIMLGANDRQQMLVGTKKEKFQTEPWNAEYERRIRALMAVATDRKVPFIWTGLPAFQSPSLSADAATLNSIYRLKVEQVGGTFIDIWDGFADENGKFVATGSDINGQPVRLRGSDGLSLTKAGKRKIAFYLEKAVRAAVGATPTLARLDATNLPFDASKTVPTVATITTVPPVNLADPELDGSSVLLDSGLMPAGSGTTPRDLLIEKGETSDAPAGRVDDFTWKPQPKPAS